MEAFIPYSVKTSVCALILFSGYWLLLRHDTFYRTKRFILLGIIVLSFLLPLFKLPGREIGLINTPVRNLETTLLEVNKPSPSEILIKPVPVPAVNNTINYLRVVYWTGFTLQLFLFLVSTLHVILILRRSEKTVGPWGRFFLAPGKITPFSWGRIVVVSAGDYPEKGQQVLLHEFSHQRLLHFIDLAIAELFIAVNWYNPAAWLLRDEMKRNHEFEVDKEVVAQGSDMAEYQLSLLRAAAGERRFRLANHFASSKVKTRIQMMKKQPSTQWAYLKVMLLVPLVAILLQGFSQTGHKSGYLKLDPEQLKLIGIECNPEGVFYKNHNPDWQKEKNRYAILAFLLTDDVYCSNINLQENEKISGMGSAGKYLMKLPETNHTFNPCMVTSFAGSRTWDAYTVLGDSTMKLLPVQLNMADYGMKSRKDTILFWFVPTESLKSILAPVTDINDYLAAPPPQPRR